MLVMKMMILMILKGEENDDDVEDGNLLTSQQAAEDMDYLTGLNPCRRYNQTTTSGQMIFHNFFFLYLCFVFYILYFIFILLYFIISADGTIKRKHLVKFSMFH